MMLDDSVTAPLDGMRTPLWPWSWLAGVPEGTGRPSTRVLYGAVVQLAELHRRSLTSSYSSFCWAWAGNAVKSGLPMRSADFGHCEEGIARRRRWHIVIVPLFGALEAISGPVEGETVDGAVWLETGAPGRFATLTQWPPGISPPRGHPQSGRCLPSPCPGNRPGQLPLLQ